LSRARVWLGCGNFGGIGSAPAFFGRGAGKDEAFELMDAAWAAGIHRFDTADAYGGGRSESFIGAWRELRRPEGLEITTKVFNPVRGDPADRGLDPSRIRRRAEESLERLGVERIDLYLAHEPDPATPISVSIDAFERLVDEGLIARWGLSNFDAGGIEEALTHGRPALVQNSYSLLDRHDEQRVLPLCAEHGIDYVPFGPLAGGWLTGRYRRGEPFPEGSRMTMRPEPYERFVADPVFDALEKLEAESAERGVEAAVLAFAWVLSSPLVAGAVCGPSRPAHLGPVLAALDVSLTPEDRERIGSFFTCACG
jgi:aryl-alcohol dehydrogenase-like predicted oxidoreductase